MNICDEYWFYLESYVFVFKGDGYIIYNTINYSIIDVQGTSEPLNRVMEQFANERGYCVKISENDFLDSTFRKFVCDIKNNYCGDYIKCDIVKNKPFIFKPILRLNDNYHLLKRTDELPSKDILQYLNEVYLYISTSCDLTCNNCTNYYKQFTSCIRKEMYDEMLIEDCIFLLEKFASSGVGTVNLLGGGSIFNYKYLDTLMLHIYKYKYKIVFHFLYENYDTHCLLYFVNNYININIIITVHIPDLIYESMDIPSSLYESNRIEFAFIVESDFDMIIIDSIINKYPKLSFSIKPFYNKKNDVFFINNVFLDKHDIMSVHADKKTIFRRSIVNENFFGKLYILPNGDTYANLNHNKCGNVFSGENSLNEIVYNEMRHGNIWFKTRDKSTCKNCFYRYLCPSTSNYEIILCRDNLCNIKQ